MMSNHSIMEDPEIKCFNLEYMMFDELLMALANHLEVYGEIKKPKKKKKKRKKSKR